MPITSKIELPERPTPPSERWSTRSLLSFIHRVGIPSFLKSFNPFELMLFLMVLITGYGIIFEKPMAWLWYVAMMFVGLVGLALRNKVELPAKKLTEPK